MEGFKKRRKYYILKNSFEPTPGKQYKEEVITTSTILQVPKGAKSMDIFCVGAGGSTSMYSYWSQSGAGGGYTKTVKNIRCSNNHNIIISIGAPVNNFNNGQSGGTTNVIYDGNVVCEALGGSNVGTNGSGYTNGGNGGSGGGGFFRTGNSLNEYHVGLNGGSDGGSGQSINNASHGGPSGWGKTSLGASGSGQGRTTRAFEETTGTLYAGGGGGGAYYGGLTSRYGAGPGYGGSGGGGKGGTKSVNVNDYRYGPKEGSNNTGGGAGGKANTEGTTQSWVAGGTGIAIIRFYKNNMR